MTKWGCFPKLPKQGKEPRVNLRNIQAIARKEIYHLLRDFRSLYLAFAMPLLLILLFGYALSLDVEHIETVVVDQEQTDLSRDFIRGLGASPYFRIAGEGITVFVTTHYMDEARHCGRIVMINEGKIVAAGSPDEIVRGACPGKPDADLNDAFVALMAK